MVGDHYPDPDLTSLSVDYRANEGKSERFLKRQQNYNISFPAITCPYTFHKANMLHNDLNKDVWAKF